MGNIRRLDDELEFKVRSLEQQHLDIGIDAMSKNGSTGEQMMHSQY